MGGIKGAVREIVDRYGGRSLEVGMVTEHLDGHTVKIVGGGFYGGYGRVSNFWHWWEVLPNGSLGPEELGYGWSPRE